MGNSPSGLELQRALEGHRTVGLAGCREAPSFSSKVDYSDAAMSAHLPPSQGGSAAPRVSCLITSAAMAASSRRASIERAAHLLRTAHHPGLFRCAVANENPSKQFTMIGAPQVQPLCSGSIESNTLHEWTVSEIVFGLANVVDAVSALCASHQLVCTELHLHQVSAALHNGRSASHAASDGPEDWISASSVHAGRWLLHDVSTFEPHRKDAPWGLTVRAVAFFVSDVLARVLQHNELTAELRSLLLRSTVSPQATGVATADHLQAGPNDDVCVKASDEVEPIGLYLAERQPSEPSAEDPGLLGHGELTTGNGRASLVALRSVESLVAQLVDELKMPLGPSANESDDDSSTASKTPSRRSATPVHSGRLFDASQYSCAAEGIVALLHVALLDWECVNSLDTCTDMLVQLKDLLCHGLNDPVCVFLTHGSNLYRYEAEDEHQRLRPVASVGSITVDAYDAMRRAALVVQREFMSDADATAHRRRPLTTVWSRRILPWIMHPSHVAQRQAVGLMDFILSTVGSPRALLSSTQLQHVAAAWLVSCKTPQCRAAALRYARVLLPALPPPKLAMQLTCTGGALMQGRVALLLAHRSASTAATDDQRPVSLSNLTSSVQCATAYTKCIPTLVALLLQSNALHGPELSIDRASCRTLLREVIMKELLLSVRTCVDVQSEQLLLWCAPLCQAADKWLRQAVLSTAELAEACFERLAAPDGGAQHLLPSACTLASMLVQGCYYGTVDHRERFLSFAAALLCTASGGHSKQLDGFSAQQPRGIAQVPTLTLRWWLPMLSPLCAVKDARIRAAAAEAALRLTGPLKERSSRVTEHLSGSDLPTLHNVLRLLEDDLLASHPEGHRLRGVVESIVGGSKPVDELLQGYFAQLYHKRVYVPCYQENTQKTQQAVADGLHAALLPIPTKDFLQSPEGRSALFVFLGVRAPQDHVLMPQPYY